MQHNKISFEDSVNNSLIQASDVIAGLLAGIGEQIQKYNEQEFYNEFISKLNPNHLENLKLLAQIYQNSIY
ncbi:DUF3800 domain-containing protein, partial [Mannheimia haemolytica]